VLRYILIVVYLIAGPVVANSHHYIRYFMCRLTPTRISGQSSTASAAESTAVRLFR
jgi:hypothetical protein